MFLFQDLLFITKTPSQDASVCQEDQPFVDEVDVESSDEGSSNAAEEPDVEEDASDGDTGGPAKTNLCRPKTRADLQKLRGNHENTLRLVAHLYHDRSLQTSMRMVYEACSPFIREYTATLQDLKHSQALPIPIMQLF